uniref:uncharacterized protein LOC124069990 isoform X3 n=1 Tax=Scatophagus argus TaxID=75038 RepID=UPI001ED8406C|nr:uncharacterized protein LOC124069990 isoform X3 [Scatophagus argus]
MRPSSRQRVAAWLLALPLGRGREECARRGRLEMISFWLLCWKLLRATAGLRRTTAELTDGNHSNGSSGNSTPANNSSTPIQPTDPVTMEISSSPPLTDLERENLVSWHSQEVEELHYPEVHGSQQPIMDEQEEDKAAEAERGKTDGDECDYLVFEIGEQRGREEVGDSEGGLKTERGGVEGENVGRGETEVDDEGRGQTEAERGSQGAREREERERRETKAEDSEEVKIESEEGGIKETEREDGGREEPEEEEGENVGEMKDGALAELLFISDSSVCPSSEPPIVTSDSSEPPAVTMLQEAWGHDPGNRDDLSDSHLSDCLQAELAIVYSDSDAGEEWVAFAPCDVTNQEAACEGIHDSDGQSKEEERERENEDRMEAEIETEEQREEEVEKEQEERTRDREDDGEDEEQMRTRRDLFLRSPSVSSTASSTDPDRRVPGDFCVQQDTLSENVSTEHVDFLMARQQWKKMEEEVKGQPIPKPGLRAQGSFQGTHTSLYPPTRSPRLKHRPSTLQTGRSPPRPPACRTPTLSISPSPSCSSSLPRSVYHEMTANNVIILEPDCSSSTSRNRLLSSAIGGLSDWPTSVDTVPSANVIVVETSNLIIRSASEFCLSSAPVSVEAQESTFSSNPFFKLRSLSSQSLVEQEIRIVRQREEEWRRQREEMWRRRREEEWRRGRERYDTVLVSPGLNDNISYNVPEVPDKCVSSPSSPSRTRKMERSSLSCDHKFPPSLSSVPRRQNTMAQRWEASLLANQKKE